MANYYVLLTDYGKSFIANAQANNQLALTHVVLGDANGQPYLPDSRLTHTALVHQTAKLPIASVKIINANTAEVSTVVPSNVGGFNLHEVGITDSSGKLVYIGNFHGGYRPTLTEGAGGDMELIFTITANNLATVIIETDGTVVTATRDWVTDRFALKSLVAELSNTITQLQDDLMATQFELLSNRIKDIEDGIGNLLNLQPYKVGDIYTTSVAHANAAAVATHHGYGTWEKFAEGRTLVGHSAKSTDIAEYKTMGNEFGENTHMLSATEAPLHIHTFVNSYDGNDATSRAKDAHSWSGDIVAGSSIAKELSYSPDETPDTAFLQKTKPMDYTQTAHNNMQPSKVVAHWRRTA